MSRSRGKKKLNSRWSFIDDKGTFQWDNPHTLNQLYFPLCNEAGFMGSVTPALNGDATTGQHTFIRLPIVIEDLHNTRSARNFWIYNDKLGAYSVTGNSAKQRADLFTDNDNVSTTIRGTFLAHTLIRRDERAGLTSEITTFAPVNNDTLEITTVKLTNNSAEKFSFVATTAFPLYCRSADSLRDHRHWTSLALRMKPHDYGLSVKPAIHHDERGHKPNDVTYFVLAFGSDGEKPVGQFPTVAEFIGEGGSLDWPCAVVENIAPYQTPPNRRDGMEAVGAMRFAQTTLQPGQSKEFVIIEGATLDDDYLEKHIERYGSGEKVQKELEQNLDYWRRRVEKIVFQTQDKKFDTWMRWVNLQPILRKIYGNSFLPHFDYGRGGRGWRDLWQDCLALILQSPDETRDILAENFCGVRLDGSNATIIEKGFGRFAADRNSISRVWMDHGVWPYYTTKLYTDQTGDVDIFFEEKTYWKDHQINRAKARDHRWKPSDGTKQKTVNDDIYTGTIIEHILVQHLTCFHNVGEHNNIKLEDADWNDLLDTASEKGESVPFSAFYGWNLISIAELLLTYKQVKQTQEIWLFKELLKLTGLNESLSYDSPAEKQQRLQQYYQSVGGDFQGEKVAVDIDALAANLKEMGNWILEHIRKSEWIESKTGHGFFNGYYNNDGDRVDGDCPDCTRMNLTGQTFAIMSGAATDEQVAKAYRAAGAILKDPNTGGYRLTTPLGPNTLNFGRGYAVVYGEKETGGSFNHMVVMFLNALYRRGFVCEGYEVFRTVYQLANDTEKAKIYPGIPEYISHQGRGMYPYLSGSASWLLMTVLTQMFGVRGDNGDLVLHPKLMAEQFDEEGLACAKTFFGGKKIKVIYENKSRLANGDYRIEKVELNDTDFVFQRIDADCVKLSRDKLQSALLADSLNIIRVILT